MDMERCTCKASAVNTLAALCADTHVQSRWHALPDQPSARLAHHIDTPDLPERIKVLPPSLVAALSATRVSRFTRVRDRVCVAGCSCWPARVTCHGGVLARR